MRPLYDYYHYFNRLLYIQLLGILFFLVLRTMMIDSISFLFRTRTKYFLSPDFNSVSYVPHWKSRKYINCNYLRLEILKTLCSSAWLIAFPYFQPRAIGTGGCQRCTCTPYFLGQRNKIYPEFFSLFPWLLSIVHPLILAVCYAPAATDSHWKVKHFKGIGNIKHRGAEDFVVFQSLN